MADDDDCRREARDYLDTPQADAALLALGRLLEARRREEQANSIEARGAAQRAALAASAAFDEALGVNGLRRGRMLDAIDGNAPGSRADDHGYRERVRGLVRERSPATRRRLRHALGRCIHDMQRIVGNDLALHLNGHLVQVNASREGIMAVEPQQGVDREGGASFMLQQKTVADCGYTRSVSEKSWPPIDRAI